MDIRWRSEALVPLIGMERTNRRMADRLDQWSDAVDAEVREGIADELSVALKNLPDVLDREERAAMGPLVGEIELIRLRE